MIALRYNEEFYVLKSKSKKLVKFMSKKGIKPKRGVFRINPSQVQAFPFIRFVDEVYPFIYFGPYNRKMEKVSIYSFKDSSSVFVYYLPKIVKNDSFRRIDKIGYFNFNMAEVSKYNFSLNKKMYLEDFTYNTDLKIYDKNLEKMIYSKDKYLNLHNIVNRVCLTKLHRSEKNEKSTDS